MLQWLEQGRLVRRTVLLADGSVDVALCDQASELTLTGEQLANIFGPEYRLLIIGAGQLSEYLAMMALFNGFAVSVCDPREEYVGNWSVAHVELLRDMPDDVVLRFRPDRRCAIVALTHDPKIDDLALLEALKTDAFYIGAIGSRRNNQSRRERLIEHFDASEATLQKLRGPIGIYIGSKTPAEIAVSVMAEILAVKNGVPLQKDIQVGPAKDGLEIVAHEVAAR